MPKISKDAGEQTRESPLERTAEAGGYNAMMVASMPVLITGVNRKINLGNYENLDVYCAISVPIGELPHNLEEFKQAVTDAAELGFHLSSKETASRHAQILEGLQKRDSRGR